MNAPKISYSNQNQAPQFGQYLGSSRSFFTGVVPLPSVAIARGTKGTYNATMAAVGAVKAKKKTKKNIFAKILGFFIDAANKRVEKRIEKAGK